jgi:hypothetical protein
MIRAFDRGEPMTETFDELAVDLARFQARHVPGYARLCAARGVDPRTIARASDGPAVPTEAFRHATVFAFDEGDATVRFRTSGTTLGLRGLHMMRDPGTYEASALAFGRAMLARNCVQAVVLVLGPSPAEAPDSSLAYMCALFADALATAPAAGHGQRDQLYFVRKGLLDVEGLRRRVAALSPDAPAIVLATSFALVHALDALHGAAMPLPPGSRVMHTGGTKGRSREVSASELRETIARTFACSPRAVVGEYSMTELSSQFWEATLVDDAAPHGVFVEPPWARVIAVDPETLTPLPDGEVGIARIEDVANVDSAFAVLTHDRVRRSRIGFELLGRALGAPPRGCSIALDEMLSTPGGGP